MNRTLTFLAVVLLAGCIEDRDRLAPPRVYLDLESQTVPAGSDVVGIISAADASGIIFVSAKIRIEGDTEDPRQTFATSRGSDTVQFAFRLQTRTGFPSGTPVYVTATVEDDQSFLVTKEDTITIR